MLLRHLTINNPKSVEEQLKNMELPMTIFPTVFEEYDVN